MRGTIINQSIDYSVKAWRKYHVVEGSQDSHLSREAIGGFGALVSSPTSPGRACGSCGGRSWWRYLSLETRIPRGSGCGHLKPLRGCATRDHSAGRLGAGLSPPLSRRPQPGLCTKPTECAGGFHLPRRVGLSLRRDPGRQDCYLGRRHTG